MYLDFLLRGTTTSTTARGKGRRKIKAVEAMSFVFLGSCFSLLTPAATPAGAGSLATGGTQSVTTNVYRWGSYISQVTHRTDQLDTPTAFAVPGKVESIATSNSATYALDTNGTVWAWGNGANGQLGDGSLDNSINAPVQVIFPQGTDIVAIGRGGGDDTEYAIDSTGHGWAWGWNNYGDLCTGNTWKQLVPVEVPGISDLDAVSGASDHVLWLTKSGLVYACGAGANGELGLGDTRNVDLPTQVPIPATATSVSAGRDFSSVLTTGGSLYTFGNNSQGQLGIGSTANALTPTAVPGSFSEVYLGGDVVDDGHVLALTTDGTVEAWGCDTSGQLGDGATTNEDSPVPVDVPAGVTFSFVAAGGSSSAAIDSLGDVWVWGNNASGQLGDPGLGPSVVVPQELPLVATDLEATATNMAAF